MNRENVTDLRTKITVLQAKNWILSSIHDIKYRMGKELESEEE
jgi:hypothetical protein